MLGGACFQIPLPRSCYHMLYISPSVKEIIWMYASQIRFDATPTLIMCDVIGQPQRRSPTSSTEIVGQIIDQSESSSADGNHSNIVALCTLEGTIMCVYYYHICSH